MPRSITRTRVAQLATLITTTLIFGSAAVAGPVDTAFQNAIVPYVVLKRGTVECGKPAGEHIAYKTRMIAAIGQLPGVDLIAADREIERAFEREAPRTNNPECSDALLQRYQNTLTTGAEMALQTLNEQVRNSQ